MRGCWQENTEQGMLKGRDWTQGRRGYTHGMKKRTGCIAGELDGGREERDRQ